ncbi:mitochondrial branched-chain alpha-ketoacid dehydrogenase kinase-domain-containing protein [Catenaria anguillulae PL171]|uniref:Protein-serine/threonine kinase n=1 Tax=Catenaria anguillulae PL171 TaxID=765915 RepID=A0A1Y2I588_9FUNG|nr:mitochondrial branched-chain alpha-ketoacid dehydrogenase kinase-domain-containing protein [Catenaria anguillulae PL171]
MTRLPDAVWDKIRHFARFPQTPVSLRQMTEFGTRPTHAVMLKGTTFLREELPIRLAHRVVELESLPHNLSKMESVRKVRDWYATSFQELVEFPRIDNLPPEFKSRERMTDPSNVNGAAPSCHRYYTYMDPSTQVNDDIVAYNRSFVDLISNIKRRHDPVVSTIAQGIKELKATRGLDNIDAPVQSFLDRFYMSRIGIRMLIGQHIALSNMTTLPSGSSLSMPKASGANTGNDYVGIICLKTNIAQVAQEAIDNARFICEDHYALFSAPQVQLYCPEDLHFMYVPSHLHHMLFELLKNSLRAVVERYGPDADSFPPINIVVAEGQEDITIKVSDQGGGLPRSGMPLIWTYLYTTANSALTGSAEALGQQQHVNDFKAPLAGYGYGLPLSRLYARYFGGDLRLISMEGYGTDAYLHLSRLSDSEEPLP